MTQDENGRPPANRPPPQDAAQRALAHHHLHDQPSTAAHLNGDLRIAVDPDAPASPARPLNGDLRIAVDFDGVLFDHVPYVLRGFRDAHGIDLNDEGMRYWDFFQYRAVRERNLTWNCVRTVLKRIDCDEAIHEMPPRDAFARNVLQAWRAAGHEVSIVTAREEDSRATTEAFLRRNRLPHDKLVMAASRKVGWDILIDDAPHNVLMAAAAGGHALLMDHPYNRDVPSDRNPLRVHDWRDVAIAVERHRSIKFDVADARVLA